jgi:antitoxin MazE
VKARIIRLGGSQGIRIPQVLLQQTGLHGEVEITAENGCVVIRPVKRPRQGWAEAFQLAAQRWDDALLDDVPPSLSNWDEDQWEW